MFQAHAHESAYPFKVVRHVAPAIGLMAFMAFIAGSAAVQAQTSNERGALLYDTHCVACHTTEAHWRDKRQATNWNALVEQVRIWQANAKLNWSDGDIEVVSVYLNRRHYHFPPPAGY